MSSNFWKEFSFPSPVDDIMKRHGFTLEELLDEDDVVVDIRSHKEELKDYLIQKTNLDTLLRYVTEDAPEGSSEAVKFRYPVVACEIFTAEVEEIERELVGIEQLSRIFGFFGRPSVNPLLANLVVRVISCLLASRLSMVLEYLKSQPQIMEHLISHIDCAAVPELIMRIINLESEYEGRGTLNWLVQINLPTYMLSRFAPEYEKLQSDLARTLIEIIITSREGSPFIKKLYEVESVDLLLQHLLTQGNVYGFRAGMAVVSQLLRSLPHQHEESEAIPFDTPLAGLPQLVLKVVDKLPQLFQLLSSPPNSRRITNQTGKEIEAFGFYRLAILQCYECLFSLGFSSLTKELLGRHAKIYKIIFQLLFDFSTNNFCPMFVERIMTLGLNQASDEDIVEFINSSEIVKTILQKKSELDGAQFMARPFLIRIIYAVSERQRRTSQLEYLSSIEGWDDYVTSVSEEFASMVNHYDPDSNSPNQPGEMSSESVECSNDADDYDIEQAEILLSKTEIDQLF